MTPTAAELSALVMDLNRFPLRDAQEQEEIATAAIAALKALQRRIGYLEAQEDLLESAQQEVTRLRDELSFARRPMEAEHAAVNFSEEENTPYDTFRAILATLQRLRRAQAIAREQAEDEGLWFQAEYASEAYLQQALRKIHAEIEGGAATASTAFAEI